MPHGCRFACIVNHIMPMLTTRAKLLRTQPNAANLLVFTPAACVRRDDCKLKVNASFHIGLAALPNAGLVSGAFRYIGPSGPLYRSGCIAPRGEAGPKAGSTLAGKRGGIKRVRGKTYRLPRWSAINTTLAGNGWCSFKPRVVDIMNEADGGGGVMGRAGCLVKIAAALLAIVSSSLTIADVEGNSSELRSKVTRLTAPTRSLAMRDHDSRRLCASQHAAGPRPLIICINTLLITDLSLSTLEDNTPISRQNQQQQQQPEHMKI
uniref:Uncharacterized protein n=1 Tax=Glossina palpalis gambiensis TaxID=67801 RepID=A0A1B0BAU3_9MUSC